VPGNGASVDSSRASWAAAVEEHGARSSTELWREVGPQWAGAGGGTCMAKPMDVAVASPPRQSEPAIRPARAWASRQRSTLASCVQCHCHMIVRALSRSAWGVGLVRGEGGPRSPPERRSAVAVARYVDHVRRRHHPERHRPHLIPSAPPVAARSVPHGQYPSFRLEFIFRTNFSYKV
jgi:hypothetical protein